MEIKSVNNTQQPNYPTIELFVEHPELLSRNIPNKWLKNQFVATSLAAFMLSSCGKSTAAKIEKIETVDTLKANSPTSTPQTQKKKAKKNLVTNVAPVFAHGEGRGSVGCIVFSPPVFISEDEAMKIILDKLKAEGYNFSRENCPTIPLEVLPIANECRAKEGAPKGNVKIELKMEAYNENSNWSIQFIARNDYEKLKNDNCFSSATSYDLKRAAEVINQELKKQKETNVVVFYDPVAQIKSNDWTKDKENRVLAHKDEKEMLLAQVEDFIKWLKTNKITIE
jgi:hypothetical protein